MKNPVCPRCSASEVVKSGIVNDRQRYRCKPCAYYFSVNKLGKNIDSYYVTKALQLYIEGISYREIERILGVSHVSVMNWVRKYKIKAPEQTEYHPTYKILNHTELVEYLKQGGNLKGAGMMIKWKRFREKADTHPYSTYTKQKLPFYKMAAFVLYMIDKQGFVLKQRLMCI